VRGIIEGNDVIRTSFKTLRAATVITLFLLAPKAARAATITLQPSPLVVEQGGFVDVAVVASVLGIGAYDLEVTFDDTRLRLEEIAFGPALGGFDFMQFGAEVALGVINIAESSFLDSAELLSRQQGAFTLATLRFETVQAGTALLAFSPLGGVRTVIDTDLLAVRPDLLGANVTISGPANPPPPGVPEPATIVTAGVALLVLVAARRLR
jgi:hypothetical protein